MSDATSKKTYDAGILYGDLLAALSGESPQLRKIGVGLPCPWTDDPFEWLTHLFPKAVYVDFGEHHKEIWQWAWALERRVRPHPFVAIWPRGGGNTHRSRTGPAPWQLALLP